MREPRELERVEVWRIPLENAEAELSTRIDSLAPDERARAGRFRHARDRASFVLVRSVLRELLAERLHCTPLDIAFTVSSTGKPALDGVRELAFNVSHTDTMAVVAVAAGRDVGVDVERRKLPLPLVDNSVFSEREARTIEDATDRVAAFYDLWTRKEALLKALGSGFDESSHRVRDISALGDLVGGFHLSGLEMGGAFSAALAIQWLPGDERPPHVLLRERRE